MANWEDLVIRDVRANQPAFGIKGRVYFVSDEGKIEYDTGTAWVDVTPLASALGYTPAVLGDWDYASDPGDTADALDQLAARVTDLEVSVGGDVNAQTGTSYTTQDSDDGKIITLSNASPITLTVHAGAPAKFNCLIVQLGAGQVTVAAGGTGNVRNYDSHTKLAGQYAMGSIFVVSNAGSAPEVYLAGNTGI